jgi:hypothetical protein
MTQEEMAEQRKRKHAIANAGIHDQYKYERPHESLGRAPKIMLRETATMTRDQIVEYAKDEELKVTFHQTFHLRHVEDA